MGNQEEARKLASMLPNVKVLQINKCTSEMAICIKRMFPSLQSLSIGYTRKGHPFSRIHSKNEIELQPVDLQSRPLRCISAMKCLTTLKVDLTLFRLWNSVEHYIVPCWRLISVAYVLTLLPQLETLVIKGAENSGELDADHMHLKKLHILFEPSEYHQPAERHDVLELMTLIKRLPKVERPVQLSFKGGRYESVRKQYKHAIANASTLFSLDPKW